jgi:hypothetical protein
MKRITPTDNEHHWPRHASPTIECRKRDLVVRIADWTRDRGEPAYDVEVYIGGVYDGNESHTCTVHHYGTKAAAKRAAIETAQAKIAKLL